MIYYKFGDYTLSEDGEIIYRGESIIAPPKEFALLLLLVKSHGSLLSKDQIVDAVWHGTCVSDESLTRCIYSLRRLLGKNKHYIRTFYSRGYQFTPSVTITKKSHINKMKISNQTITPKLLTKLGAITYSITYTNTIWSHKNES